METLRAKEGPERPRASIRSVRAVKKRLVLEKQNGEGQGTAGSREQLQQKCGGWTMCAKKRGIKALQRHEVRPL